MNAIEIGDHVTLREDHPGPAPHNVGKVGWVVDPGRLPRSPKHVYVQFPGEPEYEYDRGALAKVHSGPGTIAAEDLNASNDE
jgi:hypothetical protein